MEIRFTDPNGHSLRTICYNNVGEENNLFSLPILGSLVEAVQIRLTKEANKRKTGFNTYIMHTHGRIQ